MEGLFENPQVEKPISIVGYGYKRTPKQLELEHTHTHTTTTVTLAHAHRGLMTFMSICHAIFFRVALDRYGCIEDGEWMSS